jgi:hypothetical protein
MNLSCPDNNNLFRGVLPELAMIWDKRMREFPPVCLTNRFSIRLRTTVTLSRLHVIGMQAMTNQRSQNFVISFEVEERCLSGFEPHKVGSAEHLEYWIPAGDLFNAPIRGRIRLEDDFFGANFTGHAPDNFILKGIDATARFVTLYKIWTVGTQSGT